MRTVTPRKGWMAVAQLLTPLPWRHKLSLCGPVKHAFMKRVRRRRRRKGEGRGEVCGA